jgi:phosphoenolpyruvate phosphomutase
MKAIILNSGTGSRLMPLTKNLPKGLLTINGKKILDLQMESLMECNISNFIITTGHKHDSIEKYVTETYHDLNISLVRNDRYDSTNYIYSIWLTRKLIDDDIIILHGDMVFDKGLLKRLVQCVFSNAALINNTIKPPDKDFKAVIHDDIIKKIGVNLFGDDAYFCAPIYKFSRLSFLRWLVEIDLFVNAGKVTCYAEDAFNIISNEIELRAVYYGDEFCMEIDTPEDLRVAEEYYRRHVI